MNTADTVKSALLEDKFSSYVAAMGTIHSVHAEVLSVCRALVEEQIPTLSRLLGITAAAKDIKHDVYPTKFQQVSEEWAWIGETIALVPRKLWFSAGLYIDNTRETRLRLEANTGFYTATLAKAEALFKALADVSGRAFELDDENYGVYVVEQVSDNALASYQDALNKAVQRWVSADGGLPLSIVAKNMDQLRR